MYCPKCGFHGHWEEFEIVDDGWFRCPECGHLFASDDIDWEDQEWESIF